MPIMRHDNNCQSGDGKAEGLTPVPAWPSCHGIHFHRYATTL